MTKDDWDYLKEWFEKADHDIENARLVISYNSTILDTACFHCQQAVEKYMKAYLLYKRERTPKIHDVNQLQCKCAVFDNDFAIIDLKNLNLFAVDLRYPGDSLQPSLDEAKEYLQIAENIKKIVLDKIVFD
ncbi:MAG: HEPN domain-containing protein [Bacteroidia bacterium]|nr:HEPN domain-containing protein [Bacteroidia bacterium]